MTLHFGMLPPDQAPLRITDLHSHLVPAVDDGSTSLDESLEVLRGLYREGVVGLITTPHLILPRLPTDAAVERELDWHEQSFEQLATACARAGEVPAVGLGQEIYAPDADTARRLSRHSRLGLGGTRYLLVEFGFDLTGDHLDVIQEILATGRRVVIAHPERYRFLPGADPVATISAWREQGALLQVNVGSLSGFYRWSTPGSDTLAWSLIENGLADIIASDNHGVRRDGVSPRAGVEALTARGREGDVQRLFMDNPARIAGDLPVAGTPA